MNNYIDEWKTLRDNRLNLEKGEIMFKPKCYNELQFKDQEEVIILKKSRTSKNVATKNCTKLTADLELC